MVINVTYSQWLVLVVCSGAVMVALLYGTYRVWRDVALMFRDTSWPVTLATMGVVILVAAYPVYYVVTAFLWPMLKVSLP